MPLGPSPRISSSERSLAPEGVVEEVALASPRVPRGFWFLP
jgi:hypothetical protein